VLGGEAVTLNPQRVGWLLENHLALIQRGFDCGREQVVADDPRGVKRVKGLTLEGSAGSTELSLEASLLCQRQTSSGSYENVASCQGATLKEDDRFKVTFKVDDTARVYIFVYNSTGQFQMLFPDQGIDNELVAGREYTLPSGTEWFELDEVSGVTEYIQVVVAKGKVAELEKLRGLRLPPGKQRTQALQARAILEPIISRGVKPKANKITLDKGTGSETVSASVFNVSSKEGVSGVEFRIVRP